MKIELIKDGNSVIGYTIKAENEEEIDVVNAVRNMIFFGIGDTHIEYDGRAGGDKDYKDAGTLFFVQKMYCGSSLIEEIKDQCLTESKIKESRESMTENIKRIITEYGTFTVSDVGTESSPVYNAVSKDHLQLIERFYSDCVMIVTYIHEQEIYTDSVEYEELGYDLIAEINTLAKKFELLIMNA